jgi:excisionase family DNA binding protein
MVTKENLLTTREVASQLRVSTSTVRRMARLGRLPALRVGRLWRFAQQDLTVKLHQQKLANKHGKRRRRSGFFDWRSFVTELGFVEPFDRNEIHTRR